MGNPTLHQIFKIKSHRSLEEASGVDDLYTILGNTAADETAKMINKRDLEPLLTATDSIFVHSQKQHDALRLIYAYLAELNALHSQLKKEKDKEEAATHVYNTLDAISHYQTHLQTWKLGDASWKFDSPLAPAVAQACPAGANTAFRVWSFLKQLSWHPPDIPTLADDWASPGMNWL